MHEIFAYYPVSSWQISSAAENTTGRIAAIDQLKAALSTTQQKAVDAVEGQLESSVANAPTDAKGHADDITRKATFAAGALEMFAGYIDKYDFNSAAPRSVSKLNSSYWSAEASDFGQPAKSYPTDATAVDKQTIDNNWSNGYSAKRGALMKTLNGEYAQLGSNLDTDAGHVSSLLGEGPTAANLREMYAEGALPSYASLLWPDVGFQNVVIKELPYDLRHLTPDQLADYLLKHPEIPKNIVDAAMKDPVLSNAVGEKLADQAMGVTSYDKDGLKAFMAAYGRFSEYPGVNAGLFGKLGGEDTLVVLCKISQTESWSIDMTEDQRKLLGMLKDGLQSATTYPGFDSTKFAHELVKAGTVDLQDPDQSLFAQGFTGAMSFLLYNSTFSDKFITTVADDLDKYERVDNDGHKGLWSTRDDSFRNGDYHWNDMMPWEGQYATTDPMIAVMSSLANSPKADLDFFTSQPDRQEYYIKDRIWDADGCYSISRALDTATTDPSLLNDPNKSDDAADLASATVNLFSQRKYLDDDMDRMALSGNGTDDTGSHLGHILATYMAGADAAVRNHSGEPDEFTSSTIWSDEFHHNLGNIPVFSQEAVEKFGLAAMSTDNGLVEVRNGLNIYEAQKLGAAADYLADHPDDAAARQALTQSVYRNADLEGVFMNELGDSKVAEAHGKDEAIKGWIDMGKDVVDLIPIPGAKALGDGIEHEVLNLAVSTGKDDGVDALKEHFAHYEDDEIAKQNTDATSMLTQQEYSVAKTLFDHGMAGDAQAIIDDGASGVVKDADGSYHLVSYEDFAKLSDDEKQQALSEIYSTDHGVGEIFDQGEYETRYKDKFHDYFEK